MNDDVCRRLVPPYDSGLSAAAAEILLAAAVTAHMQHPIVPSSGEDPAGTARRRAQAWLAAAAPPFDHLITEEEREVFSRAVDGTATVSETATHSIRVWQRHLGEVVAAAVNRSLVDRVIELRGRIARAMHDASGVPDADWPLSIRSAAVRLLTGIVPDMIDDDGPEAAAGIAALVAAVELPTPSDFVNFALSRTWADPADLRMAAIMLYGAAGGENMVAPVLRAADRAWLLTGDAHHRPTRSTDE